MAMVERAFDETHLAVYRFRAASALLGEGTERKRDSTFFVRWPRPRLPADWLFASMPRQRSMAEAPMRAEMPWLKPYGSERHGMVELSQACPRCQTCDCEGLENQKKDKGTRSMTRRMTLEWPLQRQWSCF